MNISFILDIVIAGLLLITIVYCWVLSRKISQLREGRKELAVFVQEFDRSIQRAEINIQTLKDLGGKTDQTLKQHIEKARFLANDLSFLMSKGETVADALEQHISTSRTIQGNTPPRGSKTASLSANATTLRTATKETTRAVTTAAQPLSTPAHNMAAKDTNTFKKKERMAPSKRQALEAVLEQIASRKNSDSEPPLEPITDSASPQGLRAATQLTT